MIYTTICTHSTEDRNKCGICKVADILANERKKGALWALNELDTDLWYFGRQQLKAAIESGEVKP